jgi:GrpB-like predicted nucleotidyltransferase (UPF0157 family)
VRMPVARWERDPLDEPVELADPTDEWVVWFGDERARLQTVLGPEAVIEHFGSTAVPHLLAKPIVDILVAVPLDRSLDDASDKLVALGYECLGEAGVPQTLLLRQRRRRSFNVRLTRRPSVTWSDAVLLRDFLRADPQARTDYARAKRVVLAHGNDSMLDYGDAKSPAVDALLARARAWNSTRSS